MFTWLTNALRKRKQQQAFDQFKQNWGFFIQGDYFSIGQAGLVSEFGYLLRAYTGGKHDGFHSFEAIASDYAAIDRTLVDELTKDVPLECERLHVARSTAVGNLKNLRLIVRCIAEYVDLVRQLDLLRLPVNPLPAPPKWV